MEFLATFVSQDPSQVFVSDVAQNHAAVLAQTVDPEWGPAISQQIREFLEQQLGDLVEIPLADCRQDLCEVQIIGSSATDDQVVRSEISVVSLALTLMKQQPWWSFQIDQESMALTYSPDHRPVWVIFYSRK
jgi:hypothetical protein